MAQSYLRVPDFKRAMRGYAPEQVDAFIAAVQERYSAICSENERMKMRISSMLADEKKRGVEEQMRLCELDEIEEEADRILDEAQKRADNLLYEAAREARRVRENAKKDAEAMIAEAEERRETILTEAKLYSDEAKSEAITMLEDRDEQLKRAERAVAALRETLEREYARMLGVIDGLSEELFSDDEPARSPSDGVAPVDTAGEVCVAPDVFDAGEAKTPSGTADNENEYGDEEEPEEKQEEDEAPWEEATEEPAEEDEAPWEEAAEDPAEEDAAPWEEATEEPAEEDAAPWEEATEDPAEEDEAPWDEAAEDPAEEDEAPWDEAAEEPAEEDEAPWEEATEEPADGEEAPWEEATEEPADGEEDVEAPLEENVPDDFTPSEKEDAGFRDYDLGMILRGLEHMTRDNAQTPVGKTAGPAPQSDDDIVSALKEKFGTDDAGPVTTADEADFYSDEEHEDGEDFNPNTLPRYRK